MGLSSRRGGKFVTQAVLLPSCLVSVNIVFPTCIPMVLQKIAVGQSCALLNVNPTMFCWRWRKIIGIVDIKNTP